MHNRIKQIMEWTGLNQRDFAQVLGISQSSLSSVFNGRTAPTQAQVQAIHKAYPQINMYWLQFAEGEMLNEGAAPAPASPIREDTAGDETTESLLSGFIPGSEVGADSVQRSVSGIRGAQGGMQGEAGGTGVRPSRKEASRGRQLASDESAGVYPQSGEVPYIPVRRRKIVEIRVFFDDGTYESYTTRNH